MRLSLLCQQCLACFVCLTWMVCEMGGKRLYNSCFVGCCFQELSKRAHHILCSSHLAFSPIASFKSKWCNHTIVLTWQQLGKICVLFYQRSDFHKVINNSPCITYMYVDIAFSRWDITTKTEAKKFVEELCYFLKFI